MLFFHFSQSDREFQAKNVQFRYYKVPSRIWQLAKNATHVRRKKFFFQFLRNLSHISCTESKWNAVSTKVPILFYHVQSSFAQKPILSFTDMPKYGKLGRKNIFFSIFWSLFSPFRDEKDKSRVIMNNCI